MKEIKYSIIIPHKDIPFLVQRCLDSIPKRDDLQIIVVDDNSNPDIVDFDNFPGLGHDNVKVIFTKEGKGAGYARNVGLEYAKGEWLLFADADDYFETENLNQLLDIDKSNYDVIAWVCIWTELDGKKTYLDFGKKRDDKEMLFYMNEPWRKMIRRSFIVENCIEFQESLASNDLLFSKKVAHYCQHYMFYNAVIYNWQRRKDSLSFKYFGDRLVSALQVSIDVNKYLMTLKKEKYFDKTGYYLRLLWCESPYLYWYYLTKIFFAMGYKYSKKYNMEVCNVTNVYPNILLQIAYVLKTNIKSKLKHIINK